VSTRKLRDYTALFTLVDYGLSSLTNFGTTLVVLRTGTQRELGTFAVIYATYLIVLGVTRAAMSDAHLMDQARGVGSGLSLAAAQVLASIALLSVTAFPVALLLGGPAQKMVVALCFAAPGLMLLDLLRYHAFATVRPEKAAQLDAAWLVGMVAGVAALVLSGHHLTVSWMFAAWAVSGTAVGLAAGARVALSAPTVGLRLLLKDRARRVYLMLEYLASGGASNASSFVVAALAGVPAAGLLRAGQTVVAPVNIVQQSSEPTLIARAARRHQGGEPVLGLLLRPCLAVAGLTLVFTGGLFVVPTGTMESLLGPNWPAIRPLLPWLAMFVVAESLVTGSRALFRGLGEYRATLHIRLLTAPVLIGSVALGAATGGALGAAAAVGLASCGSAVLWLWGLRSHVLRDGAPSGAPTRVGLTLVRGAIRLAMTAVPRREGSVIFHSHPDLDDSVLAMLADVPPGMTATVLLDHPSPRSMPGVRMLPKRSPAGVWAYVRAHYVFFTHGLFASPNLRGSRRTIVSLWHGDVGKLGGRWLGERAHWAHYTVVGSRLSAAFRAAETGASPTQALITGNPRNDRLLAAVSNRAEVRRRAGIDADAKVALWLPTYRVSALSGRSGDGGDSHAGLPAVLGGNFADAGWRLLVKAHPLSSLRTQAPDTTDIELIDDDWLAARGLTFYELLAVADALVTDYSSVWIDFLLCDRPIVYYCPDLEEYEHKRGLLLEPFESWMPGRVVGDFGGVLEALGADDCFAAHRARARDQFHRYLDGGSSERLWRQISRSRASVQRVSHLAKGEMSTD
jgi:CDP-glycerol glycerophosphotransferase